MRTYIGPWTGDMKDDTNWVESKAWVALHEAGESDGLVVDANGSAWAYEDMHGEYPELDIERCCDLSWELTANMAEYLGWSEEHHLEMRKRWRKAYRDEYRTRAELDSFLRRVGQRK